VWQGVPKRRDEKSRADIRMNDQRASTSADAPSSAAAPRWWQGFFTDVYAAYGLAETDPAINQQIVEFIISTLRLSPGDTVFDQCCGIGRLSIPLAQRGMRVIGVDLSASYVQRAQREAAGANLPCEFHCADAFEFRAPRPCDAAINWFTSFGYCQDDEQNIKMLQRVHESLKPGGRFVIDYQNIPRVLGQFQPAMIVRPTAADFEGLIVLVENKPDFAAGMIRGEWCELHPDGRRTVHQIATRLLMPHELVRMLTQCGFVEPQLFGWVNGEPLKLTSQRCIIAVRKPGAQ
jgi:SAM-dependent methyltransferase